MGLGYEFIKGLWKENPTFRIIIGMCPVLAITTAVMNSLVMGLATTFVIVCSNVLISLLKNWIPKKARIPCFIVIVATFVTIVDYLLAAYIPDIHAVLGIYIPLIVVNCIILGRLEVFASKNGVGASFMDGLGMGLGFTLAILIIGAIREIFGSGTILGYQVLNNPALIMKLPPGAFITLGLILAAIHLNDKRKKPCEGCNACKT